MTFDLSIRKNQRAIKVLHLVRHKIPEMTISADQALRRCKDSCGKTCQLHGAHCRTGLVKDRPAGDEAGLSKMRTDHPKEFLGSGIEGTEIQAPFPREDDAVAIWNLEVGVRAPSTARLIDVNMGLIRTKFLYQEFRMSDSLRMSVRQRQRDREFTQAIFVSG